MQVSAIRFTSPSRFVAALLAIAIGVIGDFSAMAVAATITWSAAQNITDDSDVSTNGSLVYAYNAGGSGNDYPVNGVTFTSISLYGTDFSGANPAGFPTGGTSDYLALLDSFNYGSGSAAFNLTGLVVDQTYEVQIWVQDSRALGNDLYQSRFTAGNSVVLTQHSNDSTPGQFTIGSFKADAATQLISVTAGFNGVFGGSGLPIVNALQLRAVAVPEPNTFILMLGSLIGLRIARRK